MANKTIILNKKSTKFLTSINSSEANKINKALCGLPELKGDIKPLLCIKGLKGAGMTKKTFRLKIDHFRVLFHYDAENVFVDCIDTRTNMKKSKCGSFAN